MNITLVEAERLPSGQPVVFIRRGRREGRRIRDGKMEVEPRLITAQCVSLEDFDVFAQGNPGEPQVRRIDPRGMDHERIPVFPAAYGVSLAARRP